MSEIKKFLDLTGLQNYEEKNKARIEAGDSKVLSDSKAYADSLADNYDPAGTAATKVQELANGQVKTNTDAIAKLNGADTEEGSVAKAVKDARTALQSEIDTTKSTANTNKAAIEAINAENTGILAQAKTYTNTELAKTQAEVDTLEEKVGDVPSGKTVMGLITEIQENAYDDTEVRGLISANTKSIEAEVTRATGVEGGLNTRLQAVENDYLKASDKTALQESINANTSAIGVLNGTETQEGSVKKQVADAVAKIVADAPEAYNTLKEMSDWISGHTTDAATMNSAITGNTNAITAETERATGVESGLNTRLEAVESQLGDGDGTVKAQIETALSQAKSYTDSSIGDLSGKTVATVVSEVNTAISNVDKALGEEVTRAKAAEQANATAASNAQSTANTVQTDLASEVTRATGVESGLNTRLGAVEDAIGSVSSVSDAIATAKSEAIDAAKSDASTKATNALNDAKAYSDGLAKNYATAAQGAKADSAVQSVATGSANGTISVDGTDVAVKGLGSAAYKATTAFDAAGTASTLVTELRNGAVATNASDIATNRTNIATNTSDISTLKTQVSSFVAITTTEIDALFA